MDAKKVDYSFGFDTMLQTERVARLTVRIQGCGGDPNQASALLAAAVATGIRTEFEGCTQDSGR